MSIGYEIVSTGSKGNAIIINDEILIDCGVPYRSIDKHKHKFKLVLLTHIHGDHFKQSTIRKLACERPSLRFGCCDWLVNPLLDAGVSDRNIDVFEVDSIYNYGNFKISPVFLPHDVPNCGYRLFYPTARMFYATDASNLNGIEAKDYDLYLIEANYEDEEIKERIRAKKEAGVYSYELRARENHLSKVQADDWIYRNIGASGEYVYLHYHME